MRRIGEAFALLAMLGVPLAANPALAEEQYPILGTWATMDQAEITVAHCPEGLCGYLSRIVIPEKYTDKSDKVAEIDVSKLTDDKNKDPLLQGRPLLGMPLLTLKTQLTDTAFEGEIYNPEDGNMYYGKLELVDHLTVRLTGCALVVLCQSQDWYRVPSEDPPPVPTELAQRPL